MDIEQLSKSQIVLLTLLVSFVTSIATGIVTVSLMDQAPPAIAQTVNRVIERTVEKVVPAAPTAQSQPAATTVVTTEKTIVVKEADLIVQAVEKFSPSLVRVYTTSDNPAFLGLGVVLDEAGTVLTDLSILSDYGDASLEFSDGTKLRALVASREKGISIATLKPATTTVDGKPVKFTPAVLSVGKPSLGQTVVSLSGKAIPRIADGLVTAIIPQESVVVVDTNISADFVMDGSPLIDTEGGLVGVSTRVSRSSSAGGFIASSALVKQSSVSSATSGE